MAENKMYFLFIQSHPLVNEVVCTHLLRSLPTLNANKDKVFKETEMKCVKCTNDLQSIGTTKNSAYKKKRATFGKILNMKVV